MKPNVLLVVLDSVRARNCSLYGHHNETTPFLSEFADEATLYTQARAPGARSVTSHASLFSGFHVEEHGVTAAAHRLSPEYSIFYQLREEGYSTGVFSENNWITDVEVGLHDGFETVEGAKTLPFPDALNPQEFVANEGRGQYRAFIKEALGSDAPLRALANGAATKMVSDYPKYLPKFLSASTPSEVYADLFLEWQTEQNGPWAACLNLMDAHIPYEPRPEHDEWGDKKVREISNEIRDNKWEFNAGQRPWWQKKAIESLYDGAIHQMDASIRRIIETLRERGELDETLVVITSDHGEGFGEPSRLRPGVRIAEHGVAIDETVLHVPLMAKFPGQETAERVDVPATLTGFPDAVRSSLDDDWEIGSEFVPEGPVIASAVGLDEPLQERASQYLDDLTPWTATSRAVYEPTDEGVVKYTTWRDRAATVRIPNLQTDYRSTTDGASKVEAAFDDLEDLDVRTEGTGMEDVDDTTYKRLEDLGYV
jgi:arylsulfatase A-like enzyme